VILDDPSAWQFVAAGPGAGKSAVACQRIAFLVDEGVAPSRILLVSFTRTAVAEIRNRIVSYAVAGDRARSVRISTIDSHAWSLRLGFDDEPLPKTLSDGSYDLGIARAVDLFEKKQRDLIDFMGQLEHLIVDEAQDVIGIRAELILEMLRSLSSTCGVTILADPAQAIYGFTADDEQRSDGTLSLLAELESDSPRPLTQRSLKQIHRIRNESLVDVFRRTRHEIEQATQPGGHVSRIAQVIRETCSEDIGALSFEDLAALLQRLGDDSALVLFRRRADVLIASSYCTQAGLQHRLRLSDAPTIVRPWLGWLFGEVTAAFISQEEFIALWAQRASEAGSVFAGESADAAWTLLHRFAAGYRPNTIDLVRLRQVLSRSRPPFEFCLPDSGSSGPILGTIHASKGREADTVVLVLPATPGAARDDAPAVVFEEGRVYYVGATRARHALVVAHASVPPVSYLDSGRVFRRLRGNRVQLEIGRDGDVNQVAHLAWANSREIQKALASASGKTLPVFATASAERDYTFRLELRYQATDGVTQCLDVADMGETFKWDLGKVWSIIDQDKSLRPAPSIHNIHLIAVSTVALSEELRAAVPAPFRQSGLALVPVIKGFPTVPFFFRRRGRKTS
jgi:AAA domain/UvrD-like helicase C-terminal domain